MNVPIRALGLAIAVFWLLLFVIITLTAYSAKDLDFDIGEPRFFAPSEEQLVISLPLYVDNRGYCSVKQFHVSTIFIDAEGMEISRATSFFPVILQGETIILFHNATLSISRLLERSEGYLHDEEITASVTVGFNLADLLPTQISTNLTFPAVFNLAGNARIDLFDTENPLSNEEQVSDCVLQCSALSSKVKLSANLDRAFFHTEKVDFEVYHDKEQARSIPLVILYD